MKINLERVLPMCPHIVKDIHGQWLETHTRKINLANFCVHVKQSFGMKLIKVTSYFFNQCFLTC